MGGVRKSAACFLCTNYACARAIGRAVSWQQSEGSLESRRSNPHTRPDTGKELVRQRLIGEHSNDGPAKPGVWARMGHWLWLDTEASAGSSFRKLPFARAVLLAFKSYPQLLSYMNPTKPYTRSYGKIGGRSLIPREPCSCLGQALIDGRRALRDSATVYEGCVKMNLDRELTILIAGYSDPGRVL